MAWETGVQSQVESIPKIQKNGTWYLFAEHSALYTYIHNPGKSKFLSSASFFFFFFTV